MIGEGSELWVVVVSGQIIVMVVERGEMVLRCSGVGCELGGCCCEGGCVHWEMVLGRRGVPLLR